MPVCFTQPIEVRRRRLGALFTIVTAAYSFPVYAQDIVPLESINGELTFQEVGASGRFDSLLRAIASTPTPKIVGEQNWTRLVEDYRAEVTAGQTHAAFSAAINRMLSNTRNVHFRYLTDDEWDYWVFAYEPYRRRKPPQDEFRPLISLDHVGIVAKPIEDKWFVGGILEGTPAEFGGVKVGDELIAVDGRPFHPVNSFRGKAGIPTIVELRRRPQEELEVELTPVSEVLNKRLFSATKASLRTIDCHGFSVATIHAWQLSACHVYYDYDGLTRAYGDADGLILDFRDCQACYATAYECIEELLIENKNSGPPAWKKPAVILIGEGTRGAPEIAVSAVQKANAVRLVGTPTRGLVTNRGFIRVGGDALLMFPWKQCAMEGHPTNPDYYVEREIPYCAGADPQLDKAKDVLADLIRKARKNAETAQGQDAEHP